MTDPNLLHRAVWQNCGAIAATALLLLAGPAASQIACTILDDCTGIDSLPTADVCAKDDCSCAQQVECYLRGEDPATSWPLLPGGDVKLNRNFFHDRFIETRISPASLEDWLQFAEAPDEPASFADQTVVYKSRYLPSSDDPAVKAFYYLRVLEIPTPRWTLYDKVNRGATPGASVPLVHQERAYTSPIWYTP